MATSKPDEQPFRGMAAGPKVSTLCEAKENREHRSHGERLEHAQTASGQWIVNVIFPHLCEHEISNLPSWKFRCWLNMCFMQTCTLCWFLYVSSVRNFVGTSVSQCLCLPSNILIQIFHQKNQWQLSRVNLWPESTTCWCYGMLGKTDFIAVSK